MFYSGINQHKRDSFITTYDDGGTIVNHERVPNPPLRIQRYFAQFPGPHKAVAPSPARAGGEAAVGPSCRLVLSLPGRLRPKPLF